MLIHATVTVRGEASQRGACEARLRRLLAAQFLKNEVTEHHGPEALCYDLKVEGGIPFPAFAQASQEFPALTFEAEWVDLAAGHRGSATIAAGRLTAQRTERLESGPRGGQPCFVAVGPDGHLVLGLALVRTRADEWRGYAIAAERDALLLLARDPASGRIELRATEGGPEWSELWSGPGPSGPFERAALVPPVAIPDADFRELDALARAFVADWIWFAAAPETEIAIELSRFERLGYAVRDANVRSQRLHRMRAAAGDAAGALEHCSLAPEELWVKDVVLATWAAEPGR
jgi:hypothetical protein